MIMFIFLCIALYKAYLLAYAIRHRWMDQRLRLATARQVRDVQ